MGTNKVIERLATEYADNINGHWDSDYESFKAGFNKCMDIFMENELPSTKKAPLIYKINTSMGKIVGGETLHFLSRAEQNELSIIGHTGKNSEGEKTTRSEYLNSLDKGAFTITQTVFDNGDFSEAFNIARTK